MRMMRKLVTNVVLLTAALIAGGCGGKTEPRNSSTGGAPSLRADTVVVEGLLTDEVLECAAVRNAVGEVFALDEIPPPFDEWERFLNERFMVVGEEIVSNRCGKARTIRVLDMGLVLPPVIRPERASSNG